MTFKAKVNQQTLIVLFFIKFFHLSLGSDEVTTDEIFTTVKETWTTPSSQVSSSPAVKFENHRLYSVNLPSNPSSVKKLLNLREKLQIDFWNEPEPNGKVNFRVSPSFATQIEKYLNSSSLRYNIITDNLQKWIDREREEIDSGSSDFLSGRQDTKAFALDHYHTYQEIYSWLEQLQQQHPSLVQLLTIGKTYEKHDIRLVKIGLPRNQSLFSKDASNSSVFPTGSLSGRKDAIWIDAGIHAREWIAPATAVWLINELVTKHESDSETRDLLTSFDWYILPIANPDGYMYTWWTNRLWRKNRATPKALPLRYLLITVWVNKSLVLLHSSLFLTGIPGLSLMNASEQILIEILMSILEELRLPVTLVLTSFEEIMPFLRKRLKLLEMES